MIARTAAWLAACRGLNAITAFLVPIVLVRTLDPSEYGLFRQIDLLAYLIAPFLMMGFERSLTYFLPREEHEPRKEISTALLSILAVSILATAIALLFPGLMGRIFGTAGLPLLVLAGTVSGVSGAFSNNVSRSLIAVDEGRLAGILTVAFGIPRTFVLITVALTVAEFRWLVAVVLLFAFLESLLLLVLLGRKGLFHLSFSTPIFVKHMRYGGPLALMNMAVIWGKRIDRYLVSTSLEPSVFAVYSVGRTRIPLLPVLSKSLGAATAPRYSLLESKGKYTEMAVLWRTSAEALVPVSVVIAAALSATAHWLIPLVFTATYTNAVPIFRVHVLTIAFQGFAGTELIIRALAAFRFIGIQILVSLLLRISLGILALKTGSLLLLVSLQVLITYLLLGVRLVYIRARLRVSWSTLLPRRLLGLALALALLGTAATGWIDRQLGAQPLLALAISMSFWVILAALVLWRQRIWKRIVPRPGPSG